MAPRLLIHGGAGNLDPATARADEARPALAAALRAGFAVLERGGRALDAVQTAVVVLEDSGLFSAGKGACEDAAGDVTLDAAIMDGVSRAGGAVASVAGVRNAIVGARRVLEHTPHVLLVGAGAESFLREHQVPFAPRSYFQPAYAAAAPRHGTVGAVALDAQGHLAAATSTGGILGKRPGRVGDSPILGAGTYADETCAVSATGQGEFFLRSVFAFRVARDVAAGRDVGEALRAGLADVQTLGGRGGALVLAADGRWGMHLTTPGMFRGVLGAGQAPQVAVWDEALGPV